MRLKKIETESDFRCLVAETVVLINQLWNVSWHLKGQINRKTLLISSEAEITGNMAHKIPR